MCKAGILPLECGKSVTIALQISMTIALKIRYKKMDAFGSGRVLKGDTSVQRPSSVSPLALSGREAWLLTEYFSQPWLEPCFIIVLDARCIVVVHLANEYVHTLVYVVQSKFYPRILPPFSIFLTLTIVDLDVDLIVISHSVTVHLFYRLISIQGCCVILKKE